MSLTSHSDCSQIETPLLETLWDCANKTHTAFYTPGHKRGKGISPQLATYFGKGVFRCDLPELTPLDNLLSPTGVIQSAQKLASQAFGALHTWFLINGSTCGIEAAILATCGSGEKIILSRNIHSSAVSGLILSGAVPIFVNPEYDPILDITYSITPQRVSEALELYPEAKAVMIVYPTYYGVCGDIHAIAKIAHDYNIPLLVDEAHGAHFAFHQQLPITALSADADLAVQSTHKVLGAMTQASMLHIQGNRIDRDRVNKALQLLQSTSPSYLLLASLDAARQQMAIHGEELMSHTLQLARQAKIRINKIPKLSVLEVPNPPSLGFAALDKTRLTVNVEKLGLTGFTAEEILDKQLGIICEFASIKNLTLFISLGNTQEDINHLVEALSALAQEHWQLTGQDSIGYSCKYPISKDVSNSMLLLPREAFFSNTEILPIDSEKLCDRICAEIICPYPPGIPVLVPGELVSYEALIYLQQIKQMGGFISGYADTSANTIKVVKS
jgi:arginine decarboxylase